MKLIKIFKAQIITLTCSVLFSCSQNVATGKWENVVKDNNGATVTTTLLITENQDEFSGTMDSKSSDTQTNNTNNAISFSGYISDKTLVIERIDKSSDPYFKKSTLTVSSDGNTLVLAPSGLIFNKR